MATIESDRALVAVEGSESAPETLSEGGSRRRFRGWVLGGLVLGTLSALITPGVLQAIRAKREALCKSHLSEIGQALQRYHGEHGHLPAPYTTDARGRPLLSWRVALLPYLGRRDLHDRFDQDQPWDGPTNIVLLNAMPAVFACPELSGHVTPYQVIVGPKTDLGSLNTPFEPGRGVDIREITDGTSNTILVAEAREAVPWTQPEDEAFGPGYPLPRLAQRHRRGANVLLADGMARWLGPALLPEIFRAILTINGGEVTGGPG